MPSNSISTSCEVKRASPSLNALQASSKAKALFSAKSKAYGEFTILFSAKSQAYKAKALPNNAKIALGEANALGSTKTQVYRPKAPLNSTKKAFYEATKASCKARTTTTPSSVKASCEANLASDKASVTLSKAKTIAFSKTKKQIFAKRAKPKASLQTPRSSVLSRFGLIRPDSDMNKSDNPDLRDYLSNKRNLLSKEPVDISLS